MTIEPGTAAGVETDMTEDGDAAADAASRRIVIVEDELMVAWSLESMAEDMGHRVVAIFSSGETVLEDLGGAPPDLVFMDINLGGGLDGVETARRLRREWPVPILFISAYADRATRERALAAAPGALLLGKPVSAAALEKAVVTLTAGTD